MSIFSDTMDKILNEGWWGMANSKDKRIKKLKKKYQNGVEEDWDQ